MVNVNPIMSTSPCGVLDRLPVLEPELMCLNPPGFTFSESMEMMDTFDM